VLDINMPGMDGYELARRLRASALDHPPVLATVTAFGDNAHLDRAVEAGFDLHFTKPADAYEVADQLAGCLEASEAS
jgi:CheY-like chemotaxis protein